MVKIPNPVFFSEHFQIDKETLNSLGIINLPLNLDIPLFIDPLLLAKSRHSEIKDNAYKNYTDFFIQIIKLLKASKTSDDLPWRCVENKMKFPEIKSTCLGYSTQSVSGSGSGSFINNHLLRTAKQIVDLGIEDPDLFVAMGLFEKGIGPDRISDMVTNIIQLDLALFTARIAKELNIPTQAVHFNNQHGEQVEFNLPINPFQNPITPVVFVPSDILRELPIVKNLSEISRAASHNETLRTKVNFHIGSIWNETEAKQKQIIKNKALSTKESFETVLDFIRQPSLLKSYDTSNDPKGLLVIESFRQDFLEKYPCTIPTPKNYDGPNAINIVEVIIEHFRFLINECRLSELLYYKNEVRPEKVAQGLFFTAAFSYCKANNIDITPEAGTGNGPVDFKFSYGMHSRILVEIKLSSNKQIISGYSKQLPTYGKAEQALKCYYLIIDVGNFEKNHQKLLDLRAAEINAGHTPPRT